MSRVQPFTLDVPDIVLGDLRERLQRVRWPDEPPHGAHRAGGGHRSALLARSGYRATAAAVVQAFNIQRWSVSPTGGHFAALEEPERLAEDVRAFFRSRR